MYHPTLEEFKDLKGRGNLVPIYCEIAADLDTPVSAFLKVSRGDYSFLLESVETEEKLGRYSFIGTEPYRVISTAEQDKTDPLELVAEEMAKYRPVPVDGLPDFCGGVVGEIIDNRYAPGFAAYFLPPPDTCEGAECFLNDVAIEIELPGQCHRSHGVAQVVNSWKR